MTINISTGGVYFETTADDIREGDDLDLKVGVPPGDGRFPQHSKIATVGRVIRSKMIEDKPNDKGVTYTRYGVAAQFQQGFKLSFADNVSSSNFTTL